MVKVLLDSCHCVNKGYDSIVDYFLNIKESIYLDSYLKENTIVSFGDGTNLQGS